MELSHQFTVPIGVEETWAHFNDIASVAECFPGAQVSEADESSFAGSVKVKLGPIALLYNGSGTFVEKDEAAHRFVVDAKGKDKRGNGTAGAKVTVTMTDAAGLDRRLGGDRPGDHRQAGAVRSRRHAGRLGQAAGPVRGVPRAAAGGPGAVGGGAGHVGGREPRRPPPGADPSSGAAATEPGPPKVAPPPPKPPPAPQPVEALDLGSAVLPVILKSYWKQALAALVGLAVLRRLLRR